MQTEQQNPLATQKVSSLILKFTIPAIISMMVSSLYNIVDQVFIGQGVGMLGNAATNIAFPVNIICTAVALLLGIGSASNFNLKSGAGQTEVAKKLCRKWPDHAGGMWCDHHSSNTWFPDTINAYFRCDRGSASLCH